MSGPTPTATASATADPNAEADGAQVRSWGWHLLQVSSWLLLVLLPVHLYSVWLAHDPGDFGVATFVDRWHSTGWRVFDWAFLMLALAHGGMGLSGVLSSSLRNETARLVVAAVLAVTMTILAVLVSATIFSFDIT